ncbi:catalase family peroxidase [Azorhizobium oxalatiphilum]|nr:catalase family peroxidase [Azorhizobium oxalatiphilum]
MIGAVLGISACAFAYTAGWLSPDRLTPAKLVSALAPPGGHALGHRRNHAKGICFTGDFVANGAGQALSRAQVFTPGDFPIVGRFNLGTPNPNAPDATVRVRGMGLQITTPGGQVWRTAMINPPFFSVSTPQGFYEMQNVLKSKAPGAMKAFTTAHPEFTNFATWARSAPWTSSYAEDSFNGLNAFIFTNSAGISRPVRWSLKPEAPIVPTTQEALAKLAPDYLEREITSRVAAAPQKWKMRVTLAEPDDPTNDPSKPWPEARPSVEVGTLIVRRIEQERDGPCRDLNFDPTILPDGMSVSDDPFPAARSSAYARSYNLRTSEAKDYPYQLPAEEIQK